MDEYSEEFNEDENYNILWLYMFKHPSIHRISMGLFSNRLGCFTDRIDSLSIGSLDGVHIGDSCFAIGNMNGYGLAMNQGIISSGLKILEYKGRKNTFIQTSIEISKGSSGGPLFDSSTQVIGMCTFKLRDDNMDYVDGISFFIPLDRIV